MTSSSNLEKHGWWERTTWIVGLCISITIIAFAAFDFRLQTMRLGNSTLPSLSVVPRSYSIRLTDILPTIAAILGTVFAIAFAFSQFVMPKIAENYGPRMVRYFRNDWRYRYAYSTLFLSVVTVSSLLLVAQLPNPLAETTVAIVVTFAFSLVLILFLVYYNHIYRIIDPLSFYAWLANRIKSSIDDVESIGEWSTALGDAALKALTRRGEDENVEKCLDLLTEVACILLESDKQRWGPFEGVLNQLRRIHDTAEENGDTSITSHLYTNLNEIGAKLFGKT